LEVWKESLTRSQEREQYIARLRDAGLRPTRQRVQIAELLFSRGGRHLTAETLFQEAKSDRYPPSLATIYNALRDFADAGLLREIALYGSKVWYDTTIGPHFHYYVEQQDRLFDVPEHCIPHMEFQAPEGMRVAGVDVVIRLEPIEGHEG
jgi:Fur family transcriptional regulator, iron response regulator